MLLKQLLGLSAFVTFVIATLVVVEIDSTTPVAPEVPPVTVSPVVNDCAVLIFKCVKMLISKSNVCKQRLLTNLLENIFDVAVYLNYIQILLTLHDQLYLKNI